MILIICMLILLTSCTRSQDQFTLLDGEIVLTKPYQTAQIDVSGKAAVSNTTEIEVQQRYGAVLATLPEPGRMFTLYFITGTTKLTPNSENELPHIQTEIARRIAVELEITGHTDQTGNDATNDKLSLARAESLRSLFTQVSFIRVVGRGSRAPIIDAPGKDEPQNRRVEILVR